MLTATFYRKILQQAVTRYNSLILYRGMKTSFVEKNEQKVGFSFHLHSVDTTLNSSMIENYTLEVTDTNITLVSESVWGALRGLETFSQLVVYEDSVEAYIVPVGSIVDYPRFSYRAVLHDTSR